MKIFDMLGNDMKAAMKEKDAVRLSVLRMLITAIRKSAMDKKMDESDESEVFQVINRQIKQHKDSIEQFKAGNRQDLVDKETAELIILEAYMPKQLSQDEVASIVHAAIAESGATLKSESGKVMKIAMEKVKGRADGKLISQIVSGLLK